jgi:hypothetical protein
MRAHNWIVIGCRRARLEDGYLIMNTSCSPIHNTRFPMIARQILRAVLLWSLAAAATACDAPVHGETTDETAQPLRDSSRPEALADFDQMAAAFKALYGPLVRKEARYHFDIDDAIEQTRAALRQSRSDSDSFRTISRFIDRLHDAHVSYSPSVLSDTARQVGLPLLVTPVESRFLVYAIGSGLAGQVAIGDELTRIDGRTPAELVRLFGRFEGVPNPRSEAQLAATLVTRRSFLLPASLLPAPGTAAKLQLTRADGSTYTLSTPWVSTRPPPRLQPPPARGAQQLRRPYALAGDALQDVIHARADQAAAGDIGGNQPFFLTPAVVQTFAITPVRPSDATLAAFAVPPCDGSGAFDCYQSFAGTYTFQGKRVLLVRIPSYVPSTAPGTGFDSSYIKAILSDFQGSADVLVLDETNNPGGSVFTTLDIISALITQPAINAGFAFHADRKILNDLRAFVDELTALGPDFAGLAARLSAGADATERAYDQKQPLGPLIPLVFFDITGDDRIFPDPGVQWTKPIVVLTNELSFSGGDLFPMLVKANHIGALFGETTGGAGGNVEEVLTTSFSQGTLRLTRSIFAPMTDASQIPFGTVVEDLGISPDVRHPLTVSDFRAGHIGYVKAFSELAVGLVH